MSRLRQYRGRFDGKIPARVTPIFKMYTLVFLCISILFNFLINFTARVISLPYYSSDMPHDLRGKVCDTGRNSAHILYRYQSLSNLGCILLGLFWLFLFRSRNNRKHGISISKRTLLHVSDLETESEVT